jgi:hypothetical protein
MGVLSKGPTVARIKDRLQITINDFDFVLARMINATSTYIERQCGKSGPEKYPNDGHFIRKTYTNEVYSIYGARQHSLFFATHPFLLSVRSSGMLDSLQRRFGLTSRLTNMNWLSKARLGLVRVYATMPRIYSNMVRATYAGGLSR